MCGDTTPGRPRWRSGIGAAAGVTASLFLMVLLAHVTVVATVVDHRQAKLLG